MAICAACGKDVGEVELFMSEAGEVCPECNLSDEISGSGGFLSGPALVGAISGVIPFFISMGSSTTTTENGVVTASSTLDIVAAGGGGVALIAGAMTVLAAKKAGSDKGKQLAIAAGICGLGVYQLLRGFGVL